jgi:cytochrome c556
MPRPRLALAALGLVAAGAVAAVAASNPAVVARQELMKAQGAAARTLGQMAQGAAPFDAEAAAAARAALIDTAGRIAAVFEANETDPESKAKPEIWTNWEDYVAKADALKAAAEALDVSSLEALQAGMGAVGGACGACHQAYRL